MSVVRRCVQMTLLGAILSGCEADLADATDSVQPRQEVTGLIPWPALPDGQLRQLTKHPGDRRFNSTLALITDCLGKVVPNQDIAPIDVRRVGVSETEGFIDGRRWLVVDVRKMDDVHRTGLIPGSVHYQYLFEGGLYKGAAPFSKPVALGLLERHDGLILVCNGNKCGRSYSAIVAMVQDWNISQSKILWLAAGVGAWQRSVLVPIAPRKDAQQ